MSDSPPSILALDLGLSATGVAFPDGTTDQWRAFPLQGYHRHHYYARAVTITLGHWKPTMVLIEGLAMAADKATLSAELAGAVKTILAASLVPFAVIAPTTVKLWATGNGHADKDAMVAAAVSLSGGVQEWKEWTEDEADAFLIRACGLDALGAWDGPDPYGTEGQRRKSRDTILGMIQAAHYPTPVR